MQYHNNSVVWPEMHYNPPSEVDLALSTSLAASLGIDIRQGVYPKSSS